MFKKIYFSKIYNSIFFINLIAAISYCFVGYLSINTWGVVNYVSRLGYTVDIIYINIIISSLLFLIIIINNIKIIQFPKVFLFSLLYLFISLVINNNFPSINIIYSTLFIYCVFYLPKIIGINTNFNNKFYFFLLFFCLSPILLYIFQKIIILDNFQIPPLYVFGSFRGFSFDRIEYSLMLGYCLILIMARKKSFNFAIFLIAGYGLILSESRAALLSLWVSISYIFYGKKYWGLINIFFLICAAILVFGGDRADDLLLSGDREVLYLNSLDYIFSNPIQTFFGSGSLYTPPSGGVVPHNSIFQTVLNFGFIGLSIWILLLKDFWHNLNRLGRGVFIYINFFGLMHPGFDGFYFLPMVALGYFIAIGISNSTTDLKYE